MAARIESLRNGIDPVDELSRNDLILGDVVTVTSLDGATTYNWTLAFVPEGSLATFSGSSTAVSPGSFTVDKVGPYLVRLITDIGLGSESTQYVRLRALTTALGLSLVAAGERRDGTGIIPVDVDAEGWANEQNENLLLLETAIGGVVSGTLGTLSYNKNVPEVPNDSVSYRGWVSVACVMIGVRVRMMTPNTVGNYTIAVFNEATGNTVISAATFDMNSLVAGVVQPISLTASTPDLTFAALDAWRVTLTSDDPGFDGSDIYFELVWNTATAGGPVVEDWATTLLVGNISGGTNPTLTGGDVMVFGNSPAAPIAAGGQGRLRYNQPTTTFQVSVDGGAWTDIGAGGGGGTPFIHKNVPPLPNQTFRYEGWVPLDAVVTDISVAMATVNTQGNYTATVTNETTAQTMLIGATFDMNSLVAGTVTSLTLTGTLADLTFSAGDEWSVEFASDNLSFDGDGIYWSMLFGTDGAIVISGAPDDDAQFEMTVSPANTINTNWFAPYNCEVVGLRVFGEVSPTTAGVYTLQVVDVDNANNLLAAATFDMTSLAVATLTTLTLTGTAADLLLPVGTRVRFQLVSDNGDLVASGVYVQIIYRSQ